MQFCWGNSLPGICNLLSMHHGQSLKQCSDYYIYTMCAPDMQSNINIPQNLKLKLPGNEKAVAKKSIKIVLTRTQLEREKARLQEELQQNKAALQCSEAMRKRVQECYEKSQEGYSLMESPVCLSHTLPSTFVWNVM